MATRQTRRQLQFTGFEMAMIAASFVVTVTIVFFLGLFVGKKNASFHAPAEDRVARIPVDDFTKYKRPEPIVRTPKEVQPAAVEAAAADGALGAKDAAAPKAPAASAKAPAAAPPAQPATPPVPATAAAAAAKTPAAGTATATAAATATDAAAAARDAKAREAAALAAKEAKEARDAKEDEPATGRGYTVQILATRKQADADALVQKLKSRGYAAYIKKVSDGAGAWYRVRVGSYGAFSEARGMADKCRRDLGLGQAFVSTE